MHDITQQIFQKTLNEHTDEELCIMRVIFHGLHRLEDLIAEFDALDITHDDIRAGHIKTIEARRIAQCVVILLKDVLLPTYNFIYKLYPEGEYVRIGKIYKRACEIESMHIFMER